MEPKPLSTEKFKNELEAWGKIPQDIRRPLLDALNKGLIVLDYINNPRDTWEADKAYGDFLETTKAELRKSGVNIEPWLKDKTHPLHLYTPGSPTYMLLYAWPRTRLRNFKDTLDIFEKTLPSLNVLALH